MTSKKNKRAPAPLSREVAMELSLHTGNAAPSAGVAAVILAVSIGLVYGLALSVPFIFDDRVAITGNETIRSLWPPIGTDEHPGPLNPAARSLPTASRPLVNLSFALNYYVGGLNPTGYHVVNVVIHFLTALLLWSIVRRTLLLPYFARRFETAAGWLALAVALLWALHPLQTEAVIYATQRTELMMAFFYLATLYSSLRYWSCLPLPAGEGRGEGALQPSPHPRLWLTLAVLACLCGMASKEVMVSAPLMVLLFDRTFISGSLAKALRRSWPLYVGLASTWILLVYLSLGAPHGTSAGFGHEVSAYHWWLTQAKVFLMYLKLAVWPWPLLIHYQWPYFSSFTDAWMYVVPVLLIGIGTLVLLWRNNPVGYLATFVFAILAPTSVVPLLLEMAAERRMYLALAALAALVVVGGYSLLQSFLTRRQTGEAGSLPRAMTLIPAFLLALVFALLSFKRLAAYNDEIELWKDVLRLQPQNHMAHIGLGLLFSSAGRTANAIAEYQAALALKPDDSATHNNLGFALLHAGRPEEAVVEFQAALKAKPDDVQVLNNMGIALAQLGRQSEAIEQFQHVVELKPDYAEARNNLGNALTNAGRLPEAVDALTAALALAPDDPASLNNLGRALMQQEKIPEAVERLERAVQLRPNYIEAHNNLGVALAGIGRLPEAMEHFRQTLKYNADNFDAQNNLAIILVKTGDTATAAAHFEQAVRLRPDLADPQNNLAEALRLIGRPDQAIEHYQAAIRLNPDFLQAYVNLAQTLAVLHRSDEALSTAEKVVEIARSNGQAATIGPLEEWLAHFKTELKRGGNSEAPSQSPVQSP